MCFVGFHSVPNLIVILFNLLYLVYLLWDLIVKVMWERKSVKTQAIEDWRVFVGSSRLSIPRNDACALHMTGMQRVRTDRDSCISWVARGSAFPRDTHETFCFARLYYLIHTFWTHTIYTLITYKCKEEFLRENPSKKTWELEIVIPSHNFKIGGLNKLLCF